MPNNHSATLLQAYRGDKTKLQVLRPSDDQEGPPPPPVWLVRDFCEANMEKVHAYGLRSDKEPIDIGGAEKPGRPVDWGKIHFCKVYERVGPLTFQDPSSQILRPEDYVAVKTLDKAAVARRLAQGYQQNPYREAARMQEIGDDLHVLKCIEFLEDDKYLYIVTRMAAGKDRTLEDAIAWGDPDELVDLDRVQTIFWKVLKILGYLEEKGVCHRDLSPGNFLFLTDDNLVVFDLEFSIRIPFHGNGRRSLIRKRGRCGTFQFLAPEIYRNNEFDGVSVDLWGATIILYSLLTSQRLYQKPSNSDDNFRFYVTYRYLSHNPNGGDVAQMYALMDEGPLNRLNRHARMQNRFGLGLLTFFGNLLTAEPSDRSSLAYAMNELVHLCNTGNFP